jgi:tight adherence protein B
VGILALVVAALLTAVGVGLLAVAYIEWFHASPAPAGVPSAFAPESPSGGVASLRAWFQDLRLFQQVDEFGETTRVATRRPMGKMLVEAGLRIRTSELVLISLPCGLIAALLAWLVFGPTPLILVVGAAGAIIPREVVLRLAASRARKVESQLPAALLLIADTLRAGRSLGMAIDQVGHSAQPPLGDEFARASRQIAMGKPVEDAIMVMADRTGVRDLELLSASISVARVTGGDLPRLLNSMAAVARSRRALAGQMRAMTAQAQTTSWVLSALPLIVGLVAYFAAPAYFRPMLTQPAGWAFLTIAGVLVASGLLIMRGIIARQMR